MDADVVPTSPRRALTVPRFSRAPSTGVWYYHVDIAVHEPVPSADEDARPVDAVAASAVYSVLRRYSDFLDLYEKIQEILALAALPDSSMDTPTLPPFPEKETISPSLFGSMWRLSTPRAVLELRRDTFQSLLQWIERHPVARQVSAFAEFLGQPPQVQDGYTSLKEYTAPHWLKAVQLAAAKGKEKEKEKEQQQRRRRAYTMDAVEGRRGSVSSNSSSVKSEPPRRSPPLALAAVSGSTAGEEEEETAVRLGKRRGRSGAFKPSELLATESVDANSPLASPPADVPTVEGDAVEAGNDDKEGEEEPDVEPVLEEKEAVARAEGNKRPQRKKSRILHSEPPWCSERHPRRSVG